jgi:hypothetical protein
MSLPVKNRRWLNRMLLLGAATPILLVVMSQLGIFPWSPINCTSQEVDIYSGRVRNSRYLLFIPVRRTVEDSALTKALLPEDTASAKAEWHRVMTLSPRMHHSPHYIFHSAIHQVQNLELAWQMASFTSGARRKSAQRVLQLWQQSGRDDGADAYLQAISELVLTGDGRGRKIDVDELPN